MRGVTSVIVQTHQILRLPRKVTLIIDPCHTWNAIYNARSNKCHCPNSPNTAPATQNDCHNWSSSHVKRYFQCAEQPVSSWNISEYCACHAKWLSNISKKFLENSWNVISNAGPIRAGSELDPSWIRAGSELDPTMIREWIVIRNPPRNRGYFSRPPRAFCIEKYNISRSGYHSKFHRILRLPRKVTLQLHRILRLPRKMTVMILSWLILVTYETLFTMRGTTGGILQHHQILRLPRKMTLQHFKEISRKQLKRHFQCGADPRMIREWSEQHPSNIRAGNRPPQPASQPRLLFRTTTSILYWKIQHFALRLSFQISPNTAPATKSDTSTSPNTAPATKSDTWTSPNNAPATKSDTWTSQNSDTNLISSESLLKRI